MGIPYKRAYALSSYALTYVALMNGFPGSKPGWIRTRLRWSARAPEELIHDPSGTPHPCVGTGLMGT